MEIVQSSAGDVAILTVAGDVDGSTAPALQEQVLAVQKAGSKLLLDLSGVGFMSSAGLRVMLLLYRQISANKGKVILVGLSEDILSTMKATGFHKSFTFAATIDEGLAGLGN
jgi:anti-sigma B factor antagonist